MRMVNAWFNFIHALCSSEPKQLDTGKAVALSIFSLETFVEAEALRASGADHCASAATPRLLHQP